MRNINFFLLFAIVLIFIATLPVVDVVGKTTGQHYSAEEGQACIIDAQCNVDSNNGVKRHCVHRDTRVKIC
eukprot:Pgem_evm1s19751